MTQQKLEAKLISNSVESRHAKLIALFAHSPKVERHENGWVFCGDLSDDELPASRMGAKRARERAIKMLQALMGIAVTDESKRFAVFNSINLSYETGFVSYQFSNSFIEWAELQSVTSSTLH